jgi:hypothetical protein
MHVDNGRERPSSSGLIEPHQPWLSRKTLVLDIPFVDFVFCIVHHGGNLLPSGFILQARNIAGAYVVRVSALLRFNADIDPLHSCQKSSQVSTLIVLGPAPSYQPPNLFLTAPSRCNKRAWGRS